MAQLPCNVRLKRDIVTAMLENAHDSLKLSDVTTQQELLDRVWLADRFILAAIRVLENSSK